MWYWNQIKNEFTNKFSRLYNPICFSGNDNQDNDDQQSDMDLDYLAESESDSETEGEGAEGGNGNGAGNANTSNNDNNQSNQNEVFFSDEDTGESSHGEEDESEAGETDEQDGDEFTFGTNVAGAGGKIEFKSEIKDFYSKMEGLVFLARVSKSF